MALYAMKRVSKQLFIRLIICSVLAFAGIADACAQNCDSTYRKPAHKCDSTEHKAVVFALKTNLLYDLLITPNLGFEVSFDKKHNYSLAVTGMYAWWHNDNMKWYHRVSGGDVSVRRWFSIGENKEKCCEKGYFKGLHAGIYGQWLTYDFLYGKRGYICEEYSYAGGIEAGYSLPVAKKLNIDFNIGVGYMWGEYKEYIPIDDCYVWQATKIRRWIGPTKAEVQLVWVLGK